jgi:hypothetical protein
MRFKTTLHLFLAVCILAGAIWFLERRSESDKKKRELTYSLFATDASEVFEFTLEKGDFHISCSKEDGIWQIKSPLIARADEGEVKRILNLFESIPKEEVITPAQRRSRGLTLKDYGLLDPRARVVLVSRLGVRDVIMGYDAPLGDLMYVMYAGGTDIMAVHKSFLGIFPEKLEKLRERRLLHGDVGMTSRLEIQSSGLFIQLAQVEGEWIIRQPITARADAGKVSRLLDSLYSMQASSFVWDPIIKQQADLEEPVDMKKDTTVASEVYGLSEENASVRIIVWVNGDEVGKELILGAEVKGQKDKVYAKLRDKESVYSVAKKIRDTFNVTLDNLRDRALYSYKPEDLMRVCFEKGDKKLVLRREAKQPWMLADPVKWRADNAVVKQALQQVVSLVAQSYVDVEATNLVEYGLAPCNFSIALSDEPESEPGIKGSDDIKPVATDEEASQRSRLLVGKPSKDGKSIYVMFEGTAEVMTVPSYAVANLALNPIDPLVYMDRMMLAVSPPEVKRISLVKNGKEQVVVLDDKGVWSVSVASSTNVPSNVEHKVLLLSVENVLINSANLRATRIEEHNPEDLSKYGLDKPSELLTLGLASDEGIQKSVMLGGVSQAGGRYAMVQGQDVVFVLRKDVAGQLNQDLMRSSVRPEVNEEAH